MNRLAGATSPYLLQHRDNPVDWYPWGPEAFADARRRDLPVLLSVGYAACHWCHVMAHESFEDPATAALMNAGFVNVKVDREERPDVDAAYMAATQALTGQGGWPMTVFLTPAGRPFYAGTYFPPSPRHGLPSFGQLLTAIAEAWRVRRPELDGAGLRIAEGLAGRSVPAGAGPPSPDLLLAAVRRLAAEEDRRFGGFGGAPKFPPSMVCEFLLRHAAGGAEGADEALGLAGRTLDAMAGSGMYDQLAGGFARYAVDAAWVVPHFEKMLYDNALLARVYLHWWRLTGAPTGARVAAETCDWMLAALRTPEGGLASSLDADTDGVEGLTYVWTPQELAELLGEPDAGWAAELFGVTAGGSYEHGRSTLRLTRDPARPNADLSDADLSDAERWAGIRRRLLDARSRRPQPARDDKVVAAWNGLAIAALAETGALLGRPDLVQAAESAADLLLRVHETPAGRLRRVSRDGEAGDPAGVLEDYGDVAEGLIALYAVTGTPRWVDAVGRLLETVLEEFGDHDGLRDTPGGAPDPALAALGRPADPTDNAYPSGTSAAAGALLSYAALTGSARHREAAERALGPAGLFAGRSPRAAGWALAVAAALHDGPREVAIIGPDGDPLRRRLHAVALGSSAPGAVVAVGAPVGVPAVPLLADRLSRNGRATAYSCRGFVCDLPTSDPDELGRQLRS
jgi:uncharacterized protein YyaL (SSP411 family)